LNKAIIGIIIGIIVIGIGIGYYVGSENQESQDFGIEIETTPQGRNITIELSDGLSFSATP